MLLQNLRLSVSASFILLALLCTINSSSQSTTPAPDSGASKTASKNAGNGPADSKAAKTFADADKLFKDHKYVFSLDGFRKADKQDGGRCVSCEFHAYEAALKLNDYKAAQEQITMLLDHVTAVPDKAELHYLYGQVCLAEGLKDHHDKSYETAQSEFSTALQMKPDKTDCVYGEGLALAHLKQDGSARERFQEFLKLVPTSDANYERALHYAEHPEMVRARMAPNFHITALDGSTLSLESLAGKVVLVDFWATWCGPCREALPHIQQITREFRRQPLVVVSISLDKEDAKWKDFVAQHQMTWTQYRDGYFEGPIARMFNVTAIPATFTIDADGVLQDQHVGDADIEGKLKKLVARAAELQTKKTLAELR